MKKTFSLIGSSWDFFRRQPALLSVGIWMIFLPMLGIDVLNALHESDMLTPDIKPGATIGIALLILILTVITIWGQCCVLLTGRRMLQTNAGRSRTSFTAVTSQSKAFIIPFILTNILRACILLLWFVPLIAAMIAIFLLSFQGVPQVPYLFLPSLVLGIPAIIYAIRTLFTPVIVVGENTAYRAALRRSKDAVKGNFLRITGSLALLLILLFAIPLGIVSAIYMRAPDTMAADISYGIVYDACMAIATILINLCLIRMYEQYRVPAPR